MRPTKILGWVILLIAAVFWVSAFASAIHLGFFENESAVQLIILGGAISMIAGLFLLFGD